MEFSEALSFLIGNFPQYQKIGIEGYKPYPQRMLSLAAWLGNPQDRYPCIHIAGTNGKGSVSHMLAAIMQAAGLSTGLYTSPHLTDFRERIKVNGKMISQAEVIDFLERFSRERMGELGEELPSFFDMTTAMAFHHFALQKTDIAIVETGLGGRLDSTNIITPPSVLLSVITNIGLDHCDLLGDTIAKIASEKAGIIKPGVPVVVGEYDPEALPVIAARAVRLKAPLFRAFEGSYPSYDIEGDTLYQQKNLKTALCAVDVLKETNPGLSSRLTPQAIATGLEHFESVTGLRGRWERLSLFPAVIADTSHNAHGMKYLKEQLAKERYQRLYIVLGVVRGKDLESITTLLPQDAYYYFTQAHIPRALPFTELAAWCRRAGLKGEEVPTVEEAYQKACAAASAQDLILVGGSTFTVADLLENFFCKGKN